MKDAAIDVVAMDEAILAVWQEDRTPTGDTNLPQKSGLLPLESL